MPVEKNNLINAANGDPETLLENDNSKDLKLIDDNNAPDAEQRNSGSDRQVTRDAKLVDGILQMADPQEYIDEP
jgi:hypothetical protein